MIYAKAFDSKRFCFVPIHQEHANELFEAVSHPLFPKPLVLAQIRTLEQAHHWCKERVSDWQSGKAFVWTCVDKANQSIIGQVTIQKRVNCLALSYWINPEFWGRGYATEMCRDVLVYLSESGYQGIVWAGVHHWNTGSCRVLAKLGFETIKSGDEFIEYEISISNTKIA